LSTSAHPPLLPSFPTRRSSDLHLRVPGADIREAAAEELPFADASFDLLLSQLVVNFTSDPRRALVEMRRVGRRTVAGCVWDYAGDRKSTRLKLQSRFDLVCRLL